MSTEQKTTINDQISGTEVFPGIGEKEINPTKKSVLIIDDDLDFRLAIAEFLCLNGFDVKLAPSSKAAMKILLRDSILPDLILLDYQMPQENGICFWNSMNDHREVCYIPTIMMSGYELPKTELIGISGFLTKPVQWLNLLEMNHTTLKRNSSETV